MEKIIKILDGSGGTFGKDAGAGGEEGADETPVAVAGGVEERRHAVGVDGVDARRQAQQRQRALDVAFQHGHVQRRLTCCSRRSVLTTSTLVEKRSKIQVQLIRGTNLA